MTADEPLVDRVEVDIETLLLVFLDGMRTGGATILGHFAPAHGNDADLAAAAILAPVTDDPIAVEALRDHIRRRLSGDLTTDTTEIRVYGSE
ncbi:hypothetical protein IU501_22970 [Nocardia otitidiscaviarum]|uniref:hypothetical protein n=1 Tax=Nocardia otitidiscaviarum TaxID=1823 RepID=UPI0004A6B577|nr:hypothetical protein [Nocardia otitidiscaviarum]MBF6135857.1 hypothetical protein [Nocardia otitidiscaviarum]